MENDEAVRKAELTRRGAASPLGIRFEDLEPAEITQLCNDPAFRAIARWCLGGTKELPRTGKRRAGREDYKGDTFDPLSDPLDDPLPEETL